jgi:hypothetical protein
MLLSRQQIGDKEMANRRFKSVNEIAIIRSTFNKSKLNLC